MFFLNRQDSIEEELIKLKEIAAKIDLLEISNHEMANELRLRMIYKLSKLYKQCKHKKNREIVLEQLIWWIENYVPKMLECSEIIVHLPPDVIVRECSEP